MIMNAYEPDTIYNQLIRTAPYVINYQKAPKTIDYMDAFSLGAKRRGKEETNIIRRWFWKDEYLRLKKYERTIYSSFDHHTIISGRDKVSIFDDDAHTMDIITNGIEVAPPVDLISKYDVGFLGNLGYFPNQRAVEYLMEQVIPKLRKRFPDMTCLLYTSPSPRDRQKSRMPSSA